MAHDIVNSDAQLRTYFVGLYCDLRQNWVNTARRSSDSEFELYVQSEWSPLIDALLAGKPITFPRSELPQDHPQAAPYGGHPTDRLELGSDDKVRPVVSSGPAPISLNHVRAQRRARGNGLNGDH